MKKIILSFMLLASLAAGAQVETDVSTNYDEWNTTELFTGVVNDTTVYFALNRNAMRHPYSIQVVATDTIEHGNVGVYLIGSNGTIYTALGDSLKIDSTSYNISKFFVGSSFPYWRGGVLINTNGATEGGLKIIINTN